MRSTRPEKFTKWKMKDNHHRHHPRMMSRTLVWQNVKKWKIRKWNEELRIELHWARTRKEHRIESPCRQTWFEFGMQKHARLNSKSSTDKLVRLLLNHVLRLGEIKRMYERAKDNSSSCQGVRSTSFIFQKSRSPLWTLARRTEKKERVNSEGVHDHLLHGSVLRQKRKP